MPDPFKFSCGLALSHNRKRENGNSLSVCGIHIDILFTCRCKVISYVTASVARINPLGYGSINVCSSRQYSFFALSGTSFRLHRLH